MKISDLLKREKYIVVTTGKYKLWWDTTSEEWVITDRNSIQMFSTPSEDKAVAEVLELESRDDTPTTHTTKKAQAGK